MSIRSAIYELLSGIEADVYAVAAPQETTGTYTTYTVRREPIRTQDGIAGYDITLTINIYATELDDAVDMAATWFTGLEDTSGTYDSEALEVCNFLSEDQDYIYDLDKYRITQDYQLMFI